jgi:isopentenyldiphosphate isomerase
MADELISICDENMQPLGRAMKALAHRTGLWHEAIHCWFVRREGTRTYLLFQKRGAEKALFPDYLDITAAGHYQAGEVMRDGVREILEELGHGVAFEDLIPLGIKIDLGKTDTILNHEFCHVFLHETQLEISDFTPNPEEVEGLVEIDILDGLALFSGQVDRVVARGTVWDRIAQVWKPIEMLVGIQQFIPRIDSYYYKMFINAERYVAGYRHLAI